MRVFITAGEASGDKLGAALMEGLRQLVPEVEFRGIGGEKMAEQGLDSLFPMDEISIMGIGEILKEYGNLKARIRLTAEAVIAEKPDVLITIDLPEFSLRVNKLVKEANGALRVVHYVAPTVWAWRPGRAKKMAAHVDQVLAVLPFEPPYMHAAGMECDFVGHPVVTDVQASAAEVESFRKQHGITGPIALILPGSRRSEVGRLLPVFEQVAAQLQVLRPDVRLVLPAAGAVAQTILDAAGNWPGAPIVIDPRCDDGSQKRAAFRAADVAIAASGTVSLELAAAGTPMVIAYDMSWLSRQIIGRLMLVDTVTLVNLVSETRAVPEFIGKECQPDPIAQAVIQVLDAPDAQKDAMRVTMERLGLGGEHPGLRAAKAVLRGLGRPV
ncbi:lipid-A-disaccharide synthase [Pelagimonas varians]|uniref:Lipid-A-disaccharide synthase n=1 Tax=Pelagimonas varians TaxID=696760 RepID=A0A238K8U4_9RHOB|nr:lipid-A-disaccharide synthase [Pelagimonas varians]PYG31619.1 lipid-A-disaccharide synthase [Pelagimonas varians]SMX38917.1 Lipid-A-disaccharide synthase [Pelagimonas varians]